MFSVIPTSINERMSDIHALHENFRWSGALLGFQCGILDSGRALVFNGDNSRWLKSRDVNTTVAMSVFLYSISF